MTALELISYFKKELEEIEEEISELSYNIDDNYESNAPIYEIKHIFKERMWQLKLLEIDEKIKQHESRVSI